MDIPKGLGTFVSYFWVAGYSHIAGYALWIMPCGLWFVDYGLRIMDYGLYLWVRPMLLAYCGIGGKF